MDHASAIRRPTLSDTVRTAAAMLAIVTAITVAYTVLVTMAAAVVTPAGGPNVALEPAVAATFSEPRWFHPRPSAAPEGISGGSNLGPSNPALATAVAARLEAVRVENIDHDGRVPVDLVTASASGRDPHISPEAARLQVRRVAAASGLPVDDVRRLVERAVEPRTFGIFGAPRVNVITLNAALRSMVPVVRPSPGVER